MVDDAHELLDKLFNDRIAHGAALLQAAQAIHTQAETDPRLLMAFFYAKAFRDYRAAHQLWIKGFGSECWAIGRSLIELLLQAALLRQNPKVHALAYFQHAALKRFSIAEKARRLIVSGKSVPPPEITFDLSTPAMVALRKEWDAHKHKFIRGKKKNAVCENWWKGSLADLAERVRKDPKYGQYLFDEYHLAYRIGSAFAHSAELILPEIIEKDKGGFRLKEPQIGSEPSAPMHLTRRLLLLGIFLNEICKLGFKKQLDEEWRALEEAFKTGQEELSRRHLAKTQIPTRS